MYNLLIIHFYLSIYLFSIRVYDEFASSSRDDIFKILLFSTFPNRCVWFYGSSPRPAQIDKQRGNDNGYNNNNNKIIVMIIKKKKNARLTSLRLTCTLRDTIVVLS